MVSRYAVLTALSCMAGCAPLPRTPPLIEPIVAPKPLSKPAEAVYSPAQVLSDANFHTDEGEIFVLQSVTTSKALPDIDVPSMSFSNASSFEVVRALTEVLPFGVALVGESQNANVQRASITAWNVSGKLSDVVSRLAKYAGLFYNYNDGVLTFSTDSNFITRLPPVDDLLDSMPNMIRSLGATELAVDRNNRLLSFRATRAALPRVEAYLNQVRDRLKIISYELSIYEVQLDDSSQQGINWNRFSVGGKPATTWYNPGGTAAPATTGSTGSTGSGTSTGSASTTTAGPALPDWYPFRGADGKISRQALNIASTTAGGLSVNPLLLLPGLSADVLVSFLQSQGTLRTISQPRVSLLTGSKASVRVGSTTTYISKVGSNTGTSVTSTTVETAQLKTGVDLLINADYDGGTVWTDLQLLINDLTRMNAVAAVGVSFNLPDTHDRSLSSFVRARPGDVLILGGIQQDTLRNDVSGAPGPGESMLPTSRTKTTGRSELVVTLVSRVIGFDNKRARKEGASPTISGAVSPVTDTQARGEAADAAAATTAQADEKPGPNTAGGVAPGTQQPL